MLFLVIPLLVIVFGTLVAITAYFYAMHRLGVDYDRRVNQLKADLEAEWDSRLERAREVVGAMPGADVLKIIDVAREQTRTEADHEWEGRVARLREEIREEIKGEVDAGWKERWAAERAAIRSAADAEWERKMNRLLAMREQAARDAAIAENGGEKPGRDDGYEPLPRIDPPTSDREALVDKLIRVHLRDREDAVETPLRQQVADLHAEAEAAADRSRPDRRPATLDEPI